MASTFIPSRCALIDSVGSNLLVRGNMPLVREGRGLRYAYKEIELALGKDLSIYTFVDIPIIDNVGERAEFEVLMRAFGVDPYLYPSTFWPWWQQSAYDPNTLQGSLLTAGSLRKPGSILWRPFEGLPFEGDVQEFLYAPKWDFCGFIDNLVKMLETATNTVFYVHCQLGADRTGAAHTGYLMRAKGLTLTEAASLANATTTAGGPNEDYRRLLEAYAASL